MSRISLSAMAVGLGLVAAACSSGASEAEIQSQIDVAVEEALNEQSSATTVVSESAQTTTTVGSGDSTTVRDGFESQLPRLMGEVAVICYVRLTQRMREGGGTTTVANEETRVWQFQEGRWQHVHFHRSRSGGIRL